MFLITHFNTVFFGGRLYYITIFLTTLTHAQVFSAGTRPCNSREETEDINATMDKKELINLALLCLMNRFTLLIKAVGESKLI